MKGGGVAMIISNKYEHHSIKIPGNGLEVFVAEIMCPMRTAIVSIYIPPSQKKSFSMDGLTTVLSHLNTSENEHIIIIGDFNEDLTCSGNHQLCDFLVENGFQQHITVPTTDYGTLIDHIYTKNICEAEVDTGDCYYSDHDKTFCFF